MHNWYSNHAYMHGYTAYAFNILLVFFLSLVSALTLTLTGLSPCLCSHLTSLPLFLICSHSHHCCRSNQASIATSQTMPSLLPILSFIIFSPIFFVGIGILRFWSDPLKQHDNAMNECFADQPSQPQQRRINLQNPLKWWGDDEAMNDVMNECFVKAKILRFVWWWFWLCEREKVVLRENLKVCVVVVWVCERERVVLREMGLGFGAFRLGLWEKSSEGESNKKW